MASNPSATKSACAVPGCQIPIQDPQCSVLGKCTAPIVDIIELPHPPKAGADAPEVDIEWVLPKGYVFCAANGDGVWLTSADDGDNQPKPVEGCNKNSFKWHAKNKHRGAWYEYRIQFHEENNPDPTKPARVYRIDPWILNG